MSFMIGTLLDPFQFPYPKGRLTMEEIVNKFIEEGKREHEKMDAFIREFRTTNELLLKERNNSLSKLEFEIYGLSRAINKAQIVGCETKGVTTRGGKSTTEPIRDNSNTNKHLLPHHDEPITPDEIPTKIEPKRNQTNELQPLSIPFPHRLRKEKEEAQQRKFLENLKQLHINIPFTEALAQMSNYAKFLKVLLNKLPSKEKDLGSFTIPCDISHLHIDNALADLGTSISLMPYTMYEKLGLGEPKPTRMSLELADRSIQYPRGIAKDVLIKIDKFFLPIDFVILDMREDSRILIILGRPFLATARAMIDVFNKKITLRVGSEEGDFDDSSKSQSHQKIKRRQPSPVLIGLLPTGGCRSDYATLWQLFKDKMLGRCEETNLVLNWEKCHFMVSEGIVLGHKISGKGIEIKDKKGAKNLAADHLSRLENLNIGELAKEEIEDKISR
ncbi:reverse transcriptase domain-containing protein [Tanacetum coccineum]